MIDADQLEQDIDNETGDLVTFRKPAMRDVVAAIRRGQEAERQLAALRVPCGYQALEQARAA